MVYIFADNIDDEFIALFLSEMVSVSGVRWFLLKVRQLFSEAFVKNWMWFAVFNHINICHIMWNKNDF